MAKLAMPRSQDSDSDKESHTDSEYHDAKPKWTKKQRVKKLGEKARRGPKQVLKRLDLIEHESGDDMDADGTDVEGVTDNPVFITGKIYNGQAQSGKKPKDLASRTVDSASRTAYLLTHPRDAAKSKVAGAVPHFERPFVSSEEHKQLLDAHEDLQNLSTSDLSMGEDRDIMNQQSKKVKELELHRDNLRTAWITRKHIKRARVVPRSQIPYPLKKEYEEVDNENNFVRFKWERYLGHMLLYLSQNFASQYVDDSDAMPFKRGTLMHHAERVFIATTPWQKWLMHIRKVYLWEDTWLTGRWLFTYLVLLKTGYMMTFLYAFIAYIVLRNKFFPMSTHSLKESHERAMNSNAKVQTLSELVDRHGSDQWLDPLLDELGPLIQQQLGDLADYLEILINFYEWKNPRATMATVLFWISCATVAALTSTDFGNKVVWWVAGLYFFFSRPIASRYPMYRHLVSLLRWIYWEIPTHAELAFMNLRAQAQKTRQGLIEQDVDDKITAETFELPTTSHRRDNPIPTFNFAKADFLSPHDVIRQRTSSSEVSFDSENDDDDDDDGFDHCRPINFDVISFSGRWNDQKGRLIIRSTGISFISTRILPKVHEFSTKLRQKLPLVDEEHSTADHWSRSYQEMMEIRKTRSHLTTIEKTSRKLVPLPSEALAFKWTDGTIDEIDAMDKRDEAFNTVIGFSGLRFQVLQPLSSDEWDNDAMNGTPNGHTPNPEADGVERKDFFGNRKKQKSVFDELGKL